MKFEILGLIASCMTITGYIPQVYKTYKTHLTRDLSLKWLTFSLIGQMFWFSYGITNSLIPVMIASSSMTVMTALVLIMKIKNYRIDSID